VKDCLKFDMHLRASEPTLGDDTVENADARLPVLLAVDYRGEGLGRVVGNDSVTRLDLPDLSADCDRSEVRILRREVTIENTAPDSGVAPRRGASGAANRGINPTATVGASLRDAIRLRSRDAGNAKRVNNRSSRLVFIPKAEVES
jgi:hypothetical protein